MTRGMPAKQTGVCTELSEWDGGQVVVVVKVCLISNGVSGNASVRPPSGSIGCTWDCDLHAFRSARDWQARS